MNSNKRNSIIIFSVVIILVSAWLLNSIKASNYNICSLPYYTTQTFFTKKQADRFIRQCGIKGKKSHIALYGPQQPTWGRKNYKSYPRPVLLDDKEGIKRLERTPYKLSFYAIIPYLAPLSGLTNCPLDTMTIILNYIYGKNGIAPPPDLDKSLHISPNKIWLYKYWTPQSIMKYGGNAVKHYDNITAKILPCGCFDGALSLDQMGEILQYFGLKVKINIVSIANTSLSSFRKILQDATLTQKQIIISFDTAILGGDTTFHYAIISAYDKTSDSVLVMDSSIYNTVYWLDVNGLYKAMSVFNNLAKQNGGYIVVDKKINIKEAIY